MAANDGAAGPAGASGDLSTQEPESAPRRASTGAATAGRPAPSVDQRTEPVARIVTPIIPYFASQIASSEQPACDGFCDFRRIVPAGLDPPPERFQSLWREILFRGRPPVHRFGWFVGWRPPGRRFLRTGLLSTHLETAFPKIATRHEQGGGPARFEVSAARSSKLIVVNLLNDGGACDARFGAAAILGRWAGQCWAVSSAGSR
jgi:hypothetical protein